MMNRSKAPLIVFLVCIALMVFLGWLDGFLKNEVTQSGIVSFQFIGSVDNVDKALTAWGAKGRAAAGISLGLDFLFIPMYLSLLYFATSALRNRSAVGQFLKLVLGVCFFTLPVIGLCDLIENYSLIRLLLGSKNEIFPQLSYIMASVKFLGIALAVVAIVITWLFLKLARN